VVVEHWVRFSLDFMGVIRRAPPKKRNPMGTPPQALVKKLQGAHSCCVDM
jgi:hypothetical protein